MAMPRAALDGASARGGETLPSLASLAGIVSAKGCVVADQAMDHFGAELGRGCHRDDA